MNATRPNTSPILLVDDEPDILIGLSLLLRKAGIGPVVTFSDSRLAPAWLERNEPAVVVLDLSMPGLSGQELLAWIRDHQPQTPVIILTAMDVVETAVDCMKNGAFDYLLKPIEFERFLATVRRGMELQELRQQVGAMKEYLLGGGLHHPEVFAGIITQNEKVHAIFKYMEAIRPSGEPLLITGATGTGKELFAKAFHLLRRSQGPFVAVNVAGVDDQAFSDTLFGHRKGAFTGADAVREGMVAKAEGGTLFLDEIGDLSHSSQVKLLRLLQEKKYEPLGSDVSRNTDAHFVAATNRNLRALMDAGTFRADLFYRLSSHALHLPPLRERTGDVLLLFQHFLKEAARQLQRDPPSVPQEILPLLNAYPFPGNVRQLRAMVFDAVARHVKGMLSLESFKEAMGLQGNGHVADPRCANRISWPEGAPPPTLKEAEDALIAHALRTCQGNQGVAAAMLGLTRQALNQRLLRRQKKSAPE
ncbi:MAG: sigma-54-dependent Fis family transcriptional regulator [Magnetococcales bacterium]|nr:sigma-54-dependent Fis family transcriptional regulator [Magnetococcales bacterium]